MISCVRDAWRRLRAAKPPEVEPDWLHEVLKSIRWMHQEHVKDLCKLGYSPREAFWLDFACLPFLPWDGATDSEMPLSYILRLYADLYRSTLDSPDSWNEPAFVELLRQRYHHMRKVVAISHESSPSPASGHVPEGTEAGAAKWSLGGLIVQRTAREWQKHQAGFPCRLVENL